MLEDQSFSRSYEWKTVTLMGLGFGLVGLDRWIIGPLFPCMAKDLNLNYEELGAIMGVLAVCWGLSSIIMGRVSDRIGRRTVLICSIVAFSLLSGFSGLASNYGMLLVLRGLMGVTEGSFCPVSVATTAEASRPDRVGLNQGLQLSMFALLGLGIGPIIATQLLHVVPSWRWVFIVAAIPGLIVGLLIHFVVREPHTLPRRHSGHAGKARWLDLLRTRNVVLSILGLLCAMTGVFVLSAMVPSYLVNFLHLSPQQMGFVMSAIGFGGFIGEFAVAGLSDRFGRRFMGVAAFLLAALFLLLFSHIGANPPLLFALLFASTLFCFGLLSLLTGPVPTEAVSPALTASAVGLVSGTAEIFGGGVAPALAGFIAQHYGIEHIFGLALGGLLLGTVFALLLQETAPRKLAAATAASATAASRTKFAKM
jgi:predicted MFS family arabinose efflux permease